MFIARLFLLIGTVIDIKKGRDGQPGTIYEVFYEGDSSTTEVELQDDFKNGCVKFIDI